MGVNVSASHEDSAKLARGLHGTAYPSNQVNGWDGRSRSSTCLVYESSDLGLYRKFRERIGAKIFSVTLES